MGISSHVCTRLHSMVPEVSMIPKGYICVHCVEAILYRGGGGDFAPGIFRTRKFRAGFISHSGLKIEREISHLPGLSTVRASVPGGPSLVKKTITRALHSDPKPKVCVFFLEACPESMLPIITI